MNWWMKMTNNNNNLMPLFFKSAPRHPWVFFTWCHQEQMFRWGQAKTHSGAFNHFDSVPPLGNEPVRSTRQQPPARSTVCVCVCITVIITCNFKWLCAQLQQPPEAAAQTMSSDLFEQISFKWIQKVCLLHLKPSTVGSWLQPNIQTRQGAPATQGGRQQASNGGWAPGTGRGLKETLSGFWQNSNQ